MSQPVRVLFVCTGNICRSPTAEGVARALAQRRGLSHLVQFDSAGTHGYHVGDAPDPRTIAAARKRGIDLSMLRACRLASADFENFDWLLAMDAGHLAIMQRLCPAGRHDRLRLFLDFSDLHQGQDVPDPYYGGVEGFEHVLDLAEAGSHALLDGIASE